MQGETVETEKGTIDPNPTQDTEAPDKAKERPRRSIARRTTERLVSRGFCAVPSFFLKNYHRLPPAVPGGRQLTSTEAMFIIHLLDHKWDEQAPFPSLEMLSVRMGVTSRALRKAVAHLEACGLLERSPGPRRKNRYDLTKLFEALERIMDEDSAPRAKAAA
jgi:DNA-binding MarR family transcriptional regulator